MTVKTCRMLERGGGTRPERRLGLLTPKVAILYGLSVERGQFQGPLEIQNFHPPSNFRRFDPPPPYPGPKQIRGNKRVVFVKGRFGRTCPLSGFGTREHPHVPSFRFLVLGNIRIYPRSGFWCQGTSAKTTLLGNHPSANPGPRNLNTCMRKCACAQISE